MTLANRIQRAVRAFVTAPNLDVASKRIDAFIAAKELPTTDKNLTTVEKDSPSQLDIRHADRDLSLYYGAFGFLKNWLRKGKDIIPPYGYGDRDFFLSSFWHDEPILAGALYSMTAKMAALKWSITGKHLSAKRSAQILAQAAHIGGYEWGGFISSTAEDFYTTDRGVFWETARDGMSELARLAELGHIDALNCWLTGNTKIPMVYYSDTIGQTIRFKPGEFIHFASQPSSRETYFGIGYCAVSRAYKAAKLLIGLHDYDAEKLSNLPPEGIAAITGLTLDEFTDAIDMWMAKRKQDNSLTFPQVLWLIGSQPDTQVSVSMTGFSQIPESFTRESVVNHYVSTLALCFGVDSREFWPMGGGALGTASESEIQHLKAKGKGPGEFISIVERHINGELPEDCHYKFDTQDIQEDMIAAQVSKAWIDAFWPLYQGIPNPKVAAPPPFPTGGGGLPTTPGNKSGQIAGNKGAPRTPEKPTAESIVGKQMPGEQPAGGGEPQTEQVLDKQQFMRILADRGVLPDYLVDDSRIMVEDTDVHISKEGHPDDVTSYIWDAGVLKERRLPAIIVNTQPSPKYPMAEMAKEFDGVQEALDYLAEKEQKILEIERKIRGSAIPDEEVTRGASATVKTISSELARWRSNPILAKYALSVEEEAALLATAPKPKVNKSLQLESVIE